MSSLQKKFWTETHHLQIVNYIEKAVTNLYYFGMTGIQTLMGKRSHTYSKDNRINEL